MRLRPGLLQRLAIVTTLALPVQAHADFSAKGRTRKKPAATTQAQPGTRSQQPASRPANAASNGATERSSEALIARYTALALAQPGSSFPVERLAQLYRERDGNLDALIAVFEKRTEGKSDEAWNAKLALAAVYSQAQKPDLAQQMYQRAAGERPGSPLPQLALGRLLQDRQKLPEARAAFEAALPLLKDATQREQTQRTLRGLCLDLGEWQAAERYHDELVKQAKGSFYVRAELGRELMQRGQDARAEEQYRQLVKSAGGDHRATSAALRDLGVVLGKQKKYREAIETLERALRSAGDSGMRRDILLISAQFYRQSDRTAELVALLEKQRPLDFESQRLLAELYEESGELDKALGGYRAALAQQQRDVTTRLKVIQLLQLQGKLDEAIAEYERLIKNAPHNPDFVFRLAEARIQRGERDKALGSLQALETRSRQDPDTLQALVDFYEGIGENARALRLLESLTAGATRDPQIWVELGNRYFNAGDKERAERTWKRVLQAGHNPAQAWLTLGEVYLEHDMSEQALEAFGRAIKLAPGDPQYKKAYALALERSASARTKNARTRQYGEAEKLWQELLDEHGPSSEALAREARQHIVTLWSLSGELTRRLPALDKRLRAASPDLDAGRLLAEGQLRLRDHAAAESTLELLRKHAPGDREVHLALERALVAQHKPDRAISVLESLVRIDPQRAREYYQRMAQYAAEQYQDDRALEYAERVVELGPDDADSHRKLAEMYRRRQETGKAIEALRVALSKNDRQYPTYLELAELLINQGKLDEADRLLRRVAQQSPDDALVTRAVRSSIQINLGQGTLESLEQDLLPLALSSPHRPLFRRLLVEIYGALALPLTTQSRASDPVQRKFAHDGLERIGRRAVKPLLDALADQDESQQRIAIELLSKLQNPSAAPALFAYATAEGDPVRRARAMIAVGSLDEASLLPKLEAFVLPASGGSVDDSDPVMVAAVWALARSSSPRAARALQRLAPNSSGNVRALCALGLGAARARGASALLLQMALDDSEGQIVRAAAAHALADLAASKHASELMELAKLSDPDVRALVLVALTRLHAPDSEERTAALLLSPDPTVAHGAWSSALILATGQTPSAEQPFPTPDGLVDVRAILRALVPTDYTPDEEALALERLAPALGRATLTALRGPSEGALRAIDLLLARGGAPAFGPLTERVDQASVESRKRAEQAARDLAQGLTEPVSALLDHPMPRVRTAALTFLGTRETKIAEQAALRALGDQDVQVQDAALSLAGRLGSVAVAREVARLLSGDSPWPTRVKAAEALGQMTRASQDASARKLVSDSLARAAESDGYALVRQAALRGLSRFDSAAAGPLLQRASKRDPEARVRELARNLLGASSRSQP